VTKEHRSKSHSLGVILEGDQLSDSGLSVAFKSQSPLHAASDALLLCSWCALALDHCEQADVGARQSLAAQSLNLNNHLTAARAHGRLCLTAV